MNEELEKQLEKFQDIGLRVVELSKDKPELWKKNGQFNVTQLARILGIKQPTLQRIFSGKVETPETETLQSLASYYKCSIEQLLNTPVAMFKDKNVIHWDQVANKGKDTGNTLSKLALDLYKVPLYSWETINIHQSIHSEDSTDFVLMPKDAMQYSMDFAFKVPNKFKKVFPELESLIFSIEAPIEPLSKVLCVIDDELDVREFIRVTSDGARYALRSLLDGVTDEFDDKTKTNIKGVLVLGNREPVQFL